MSNKQFGQNIINRLSCLVHRMGLESWTMSGYLITFALPFETLGRKVESEWSGVERSLLFFKHMP